MKTIIALLLATFLAGCNQRSSKLGQPNDDAYLIVESQLATKRMAFGDVEVRKLTIKHKNVIIKANCDSWDLTQNSCGRLQVGHPYYFDRDNEYLDSALFMPHAVIRIESEKME